MIESQQKAIVTFGSKAHAVQFAKQWNRYSSLFPLLDRFGLSVKHLLLACPITTELFQKNRYDLNVYNNVRDILYNTDVITNIVRSIVHSPVGKLV